MSQTAAPRKSRWASFFRSPGPGPGLDQDLPCPGAPVDAHPRGEHRNCALPSSMYFVIHRFSIAPSYSLSRSYQANENVQVTTKLMLPLDVCNVISYVLFISASAVTRLFRDSLPLHRYFCFYDWIFLVSFRDSACLKT